MDGESMSEGDEGEYLHSTKLLSTVMLSASLNCGGRASMQAPPLLIGVAGGTASGKTTVCRIIAEKMDDERVVIISMDSFYRPLTPEERANLDGMHVFSPTLRFAATQATQYSHSLIVNVHLI
jgi:pantothenate kinase-related protein Tda10